MNLRSLMSVGTMLYPTDKEFVFLNISLWIHTYGYGLGGIQDQPDLEVTLSSGKPRRFWWLSKHPVQS